MERKIPKCIEKLIIEKEFTVDKIEYIFNYETEDIIVINLYSNIFEYIEGEIKPISYNKWYIALYNNKQLLVDFVVKNLVISLIPFKFEYEVIAIISWKEDIEEEKEDIEEED